MSIRPPLLLLTLVCAAAAAVGCHRKERFVGVPPEVPSALCGNVKDAGADVVWATERPATSLVEYGPSAGYGFSAGDDTQKSASHSVSLSALAPSTQYHYRVKSLDELGNVLFSFDKTFTTAAPGVTVPCKGSYGFETSVQGVTAQTFTDSQAVTAVERSADRARSGAASLKLTLDLKGGDAHLSKGEIFLETKTENGVLSPAMDFVDFSGRVLSAWVYAPPGASAGFSGAQMFVKDVNGKTQYGPFANLTDNAWTQAAMTVGGGGNGFTDTGFDASQIVLIGVKIGAGGGSTSVYAGPIYVDDMEIQ